MHILHSIAAVHGKDVILDSYKREAKQTSRKKGLSFSRCLDEIAQREGYRNWSLLSKDWSRQGDAYKKHLAVLLNSALSNFSFLQKVGSLNEHLLKEENGTARHNILGGLFAYPKERRMISRDHERLSLFKEIYPDSPLVPYAKREEIKMYGRTKLESDQIDVCFLGLLQIAVSYFARSAGKWIGNKGRIEDHPGFWSFTAHLARSDLWRNDFHNVAATEALKQLKNLLPLSVPSRVANTYWS